MLTENEEQHRQLTDLQWELTQTRIRCTTYREIILDLVAELQRVGVSYLRDYQLEKLKDKLLGTTTDTEETEQIG